MIRFTPTAWAKLLHLRDAGPTEVGGFGITPAEDLLLVEEFALIEQSCSEVTGSFDDESIARHFEKQVDEGRRSDQFARIWIHTHPGDSARPSGVDEATFGRVFGRCDCSRMACVRYARNHQHLTRSGDLMTVPSDRFLRQQDFVPRDRLSAMTATVIGVGAIGRQVAIQLAALGCPRLQLIDFDTVEPINITTQGYFHADLRCPKVDATAGLLWQIEPQLDVATINDRFRPQHQVGQAVFCCVDRISTRAAIWRSLEPRCEFWCDGRMRGEVLRILTATDLQSRRHYAGTLFPQSQAQPGPCTSRSTIYTATIAAGFMLHQFARWLRRAPIDHNLTLSLASSELSPTELQAETSDYVVKCS